MKKLLFVFAALLMIGSASAQKVKFKKDKALIDDVEVYNVDKDGMMMTLATLSGNEFITILTTTYQEKNPHHYNANNPHAHKFPQFVTKEVHTVRFLKSGAELYTDQSFKDIVKNVHKSGMVDAEGNLDDEKVNIFINKYNNENLKLKL